MTLTNTKSLLAKLLASENLTVEHGNFPTASMDIKNRVQQSDFHLPVVLQVMILCLLRTFVISFRF